MLELICMKDICPQSDTQVLEGEVLRVVNGMYWEPIEPQVVPAGTHIRAGSVVVKDEILVQPQIKDGTFMARGECAKHFNLETIFGEAQARLFNDERHGPIADMVRSYGVFTVEQVAENAIGTDMKSSSIAVNEILIKHGFSPEQANQWQTIAKAVVKEN